MTDPTATPPRPTPPPPGIVHLLLWTAGSALLLLFYRRIDATYEYPESWQLFRQVSQVPQSMAFGAALASFSMFYFYRRRGLPYPRHPGHWLLLHMGVAVTTAWVLFELMPPGSDHEYQKLRTLTYQAVGTFLEVLVFLTGTVALLLKRDIIWSVVFLATIPMAMLNLFVWLLVLGVLPGLGDFARPEMSHLLLANVTVPQLGVLAARLIDFVTRTRRDWPHHVGVMCFLLIPVVAWSWHIWNYFVPYTS